MRDEYDFSSGVKNPYTRQQKTTVTIRLDKTTVEYFKSLSEEVSMTDCATKRRKPVLAWTE